MMFCLADGLYIQCFSRVAPGRGVLGMPVTEEGHGKTVTFITLKHDYTSLKRSPKWKDEPKVSNLLYSGARAWMNSYTVIRHHVNIFRMH